MIAVRRVDPRQPEVRALIAELDLYMQALYPAESNHLLDIETMCQPQMRYFAATVNGETLGCGGFWAHEEYAEVKRLYVHPRSRGLGLARKLMGAIEDEMRREAFRLARLETGVHQPEALGLYAMLGYNRCAPYGDYPANDPLSVFMEKKL